MKTYEIGFLVREEKDAEEISRIVSGFKAVVLNENKAKKIQLSYPIKKQSSAYFGSLSFSLAPQDLSKLNDALKINANKILRFLITAPVASSSATKTKTATPPINKIRKASITNPAAQTPTTIKSEPTRTLSNEALEKKLEEILK